MVQMKLFTRQEQRCRHTEWTREHREGGQEGRGMSEAGGAQMRGCLHSPLLASEDRTGKTKHEILLKEQRQSLI